MTGIELIAAERERQISVEGWTSQHDDAHAEQELANAACYYADAAALIQHGFTNYDVVPSGWQWEKSWWKPSPDPIRNLEKAGALIAAEIDRLQRLKEKANGLQQSK